MDKQRECRGCANAQLNYRDKRRKGFCKAIKIYIGPQTSARYCPEYVPKYGRNDIEEKKI